MTTRQIQTHTHDKENTYDLTHLKNGKILGKEGKMEQTILGVNEEDIEDDQLLAAKRKMKQKGVEGFVLSVK